MRKTKPSIEGEWTNDEIDLTGTAMATGEIAPSTSVTVHLRAILPAGASWSKNPFGGVSPTVVAEIAGAWAA